MPEPSKKPIYGTDLSKPLSELVTEWRSQIVQIRGQMHDFAFAVGWKEELETLQGGLTCMLMAMHDTLERAKANEALKESA